MLDVKNLYKTFNPGTVNEKTALRGVDLHMEDGQFVRSEERRVGKECRL